MSENNQAMGGYGFSDDDVQPQGSSISFGLNQSAGYLSKFEYIPNGGKDGAEQDAIDIEFTVEGRDFPIKYRKFPVTKAYDRKNGNAEITDPTNPVFKEAVNEFNQVITHILGCFIPKDVIKEAFSKPISSFKEFAKICEGLLPADYKTRPLDMFFQYQWNIKEDKDVTFLELPSKMSQGKFLYPATTNNWKEVRTSKVLKYVDASDESIVHPFQRGEWFLGSNWAKQQKNESSSTTHESGSTGSAW